MDGEHTSIVFSSEIRALTEQNSSFDKGVLRVCYSGVNRNKSCISKETVERCISSIYNCPIVCRYDRETDTIGAHDVDIVRTVDGGMKMINVTQPVGVVPTGANYWWEEITEDNGDVHEYLCVEALLWKRQEAYQKIHDDGIVEESMEINIKSSKLVDGIFHILDFEFTAFCLLGSASPCFESASIELFALDEFKVQMAAMMDELKASYTLVQSSDEADIDTTFSSKGGSTVLIDEIEVIEDQVSENEEPVAEDEADVEPVEPEAEQPAEEESAPDGEADFTLNCELESQLRETFRGAEKVQTECGEWPRYWMVDFDADKHEVYAEDSEDWHMYGFSYSMNGDNVVVDFASKTRKKWAIVDFDEGEQPALFAAVIEAAKEACNVLDASWSEKYNVLNDEAESLRKFKRDTEANSVFAMFEDLEGIEAFEALKANCAKYSRNDLEEKCYAIRGRNGTSAKFSVEPTASKVVIEATVDDEPYGGLFVEYGSK